MKEIIDKDSSNNYLNTTDDMKSNNNNDNDNDYNHQTFYLNSYQYIKDELFLHDLKLYLSFLKLKKTLLGENNKELSGLIISDEKIEDVLYERFYDILRIFDSTYFNFNTFDEKNTYFINTDSITEQDVNKKIKAVLFLIDKLDNKIKEKKQTTLNNNIFLSLHDLKIHFKLSDIEYYIIIVCLAIELDSKYENIYAYMQDNISKKRPTLDLILRILDLDFIEKIKTIDNLRNCHLFEYNLIEYLENQPGFTSRLLKIHNDILQFILSDAKHKKNINNFLSLYSKQTIHEELKKNENLTLDLFFRYK